MASLHPSAPVVPRWLSLPPPPTPAPLDHQPQWRWKHFQSPVLLHATHHRQGSLRTGGLRLKAQLPASLYLPWGRGPSSVFHIHQGLKKTESDKHLLAS